MGSEAGLQRGPRTVHTKHGAKKQNFWVKSQPAQPERVVRVVHEHQVSFRELKKKATVGAFATVGALGGGLAGYTMGNHVGRVYGVAQTGLKTGGRLGAWAGRNIGAAGGTLAGTSLGYAYGRHYVRR